VGCNGDVAKDLYRSRLRGSQLVRRAVSSEVMVVAVGGRSWIDSQLQVGTVMPLLFVKVAPALGWLALESLE
jgi:hypothetical protein